jgi:hypothetical protein
MLGQAAERNARIPAPVQGVYKPIGIRAQNATTAGKHDFIQKGDFPRGSHQARRRRERVKFGNIAT